MWKFVLGCSVLAASACFSVADDSTDAASEWTSDFSADKDLLTATGRNLFFILEPGYQLVFEGDDEKVMKTVLNETKSIDGVECRVVEERELKKGELVEVSRNYFAISKRTNSVDYFGEDVDEYKKGKVVGHSGSWIAGKDGAKFGLMMPGKSLNWKIWWSTSCMLKSSTVPLTGSSNACLTSRALASRAWS